MKSRSQYFVQARGQHCTACPKRLDQDAARARERGLLTDDIAKDSKNPYAVERWHTLAAARIVG